MQRRSIVTTGHLQEVVVIYGLSNDGDSRVTFKVVHLKPNSITLAGSELVRSWFEAKFHYAIWIEPPSNQIRTGSESDSVMEFGKLDDRPNFSSNRLRTGSELAPNGQLRTSSVMEFGFYHKPIEVGLFAYNTVVQQLARFQLTLHMVRSLGDSGASLVLVLPQLKSSLPQVYRGFYTAPVDGRCNDVNALIEIHRSHS